MEIVQEAGDSETAVMSQKVVTEKSYALEAIIDTKATRDNSKESIIRDVSDKFFFCDASGNVIAEITRDGIKAFEFIFKNGTLLSKILELLQNGKVDKEAGKGLSTNDFSDDYRNDIEKSVKCNNDKRTVIRDISDGFIFTDTLGNVIAEITKSGIKAFDFSNPDYEIRHGGDGFIFTDAQGNIIAQIDKNGIKATTFKTKNDDLSLTKKIWEGKEFFVVGDSVCSSKYPLDSPYRSWMPKFMVLTGASFDLGYNNAGISAGGTQSVQGDTFAGQMRLRKLLDEKQPEILFYENINDSLTDGTIDDEAFMMSEIINLDTEVQSDQTGARTYFTENINTITNNISEDKRKHGVVLRQPYYSSGIQLTVSGSITNAGTLIIELASSVEKGINVKAGDTIENVIDKIAEYNYQNWDVAKTSSNTVVFSPNNPSVTASITTLDAGNTGLSVVEENISNAIRYQAFYFVSHDITKWSNVDKWKTDNGISYYSKIKGIIEYVQTKVPYCLFVLLGFPRVSYDFTGNTYKRQDGTFDIEKYKQSSSGTAQEKQLSMQEEIADYMQVKFANVPKVWGVSIYNGREFFPEKNVHPKPEGYDRYAESLYNLMFNY